MLPRTMRILLDECLPRKLKREFHGYEVSTVPEMGWSGLKNGALLREMAGIFDVFVTIDGNLQYQQNLTERYIAVVVLNAANNTLVSLLPLMPQVRQHLTTLRPGEIVRIVGDR